MGFWIEFFRDKRFSWRFKLANFIMNDYLRNYLAVGCMLPLDKIVNLEATTGYEKQMQKWAKQARESVVDVMSNI